MQQPTLLLLLFMFSPRKYKVL